MKSLQETPSPELEEANELINRASAEVQRMLDKQNGRVPRANITAALHLLRDVLEANAHMEKANYARVRQLLHWAAPEVPA